VVVTYPVGPFLSIILIVAGWVKCRLLCAFLSTLPYYAVQSNSCFFFSSHNYSTQTEHLSPSFWFCCGSKQADPHPILPVWFKCTCTCIEYCKTRNVSCFTSIINTLMLDERSRSFPCFYHSSSSIIAKLTPTFSFLFPSLQRNHLHKLREECCSSCTRHKISWLTYQAACRNASPPHKPLALSRGNIVLHDLCGAERTVLHTKKRERKVYLKRIKGPCNSILTLILPLSSVSISFSCNMESCFKVSWNLKVVPHNMNRMPVAFPSARNCFTVAFKSSRILSKENSVSNAPLHPSFQNHIGKQEVCDLHHHQHDVQFSLKNVNIMQNMQISH